MRVRVVVKFLASFEEHVEQLASDLSGAAAEGQHELDELLAVLPARIRRILRQTIQLRPVGCDPITPIGGSEAPSVLAFSSGPDGSPATPRAGRPLGLSTRRRQLLAGETAVPRFTEYRTNLGLSLAAVAELATARGREISKNTIGNLESGEVIPRRHHAEALAIALERPLAEILAMLEIEIGHVVQV